MNNPFIIAEIGINHNGDIETAKQLIVAAHESGADAVKFQKRTIDTVYTQEYLSSERESPWGSTQREQKEGLEFDQGEYDEIDALCRELGIQWSASAWDENSQRFLQKYDLPFNKVASAMITHIPLMELIAEEGKHTYISTGMTTLEQIDQVVGIFRDANCPFTLLHCVSTYPCRDEDCNLEVINTLRERYSCAVGYSGHEEEFTPSVVAAAMGASAIERHITLNKNMYGSDQSASLEPFGFAVMTSVIRQIPHIIGSGTKTVLEEEVPIAKKLRYFEEA